MNTRLCEVVGATFGNADHPMAAEEETRERIVRSRKRMIVRWVMRRW
jgi:hypothetical protein